LGEGKSLGLLLQEVTLRVKKKKLGIQINGKFSDTSSADENK
jgi:hypothetical protein